MPADIVIMAKLCIMIYPQQNATLLFYLMERPLGLKGDIGLSTAK